MCTLPVYMRGAGRCRRRCHRNVRPSFAHAATATEHGSAGLPGRFICFSFCALQPIGVILVMPSRMTRSITVKGPHAKCFMCRGVYVCPPVEDGLEAGGGGGGGSVGGLGGGGRRGDASSLSVTAAANYRQRPAQVRAASCTPQRLPEPRQAKCTFPARQLGKELAEWGVQLQQLFLLLFWCGCQVCQCS